METIPSRVKIYLDTPPQADFVIANGSLVNRLQWPIFTVTLILNDVLCIGVAFLLAYFIRFNLLLPLFQQDANASLIYYRTLVTFLIPLWMIIFAIQGLYDHRNLLGGIQEYSLIFNSTSIGMAIVIAAGFLAPSFIFARGWLLLAWILVFIVTDFGRFTVRRLVYYLRKKGFFLTPALIVGANEEGISLANQLLNWKTSGLHLLGFIDEKFAPGTAVVGHLYTLGRVEQLENIIHKFGIEEIVFASSAFSSRDNILDLFQTYGFSKKVNLRMSSGLYEIITTGLTIKEFAYVPLVCVNKVRLKGADQVLKFIADYILAIPLLILLLPVFFVIAILVKLDSPGPVIHRRRVMGINGSQFDAYKFRTMYINGDEILAINQELQKDLAKNHKLKDDPRVTRFGKILRKTSLDELPQLLNVLRGEMSLVGPRMISPSEVEMYNQWDINLLTVRPGITGLWQVSGRSDISYEERVRLDMYYIRNWSIWLDLHLLFQTLPAVLNRRGAY